jgi:hypothetical protein
MADITVSPGRSGPIEVLVKLEDCDESRSPSMRFR